MALNTLSTLNDPDWIKLFTIMESPDVSECQVNGPDSVWVKHKGKRRLISDISWRNDEEYAESVRNALGGTGFISSHMPYDEMGALFEGPIAYKGSKGKIIRGRAHLVLPPASSVPLLTFAKKSQSLVTLDAIADKGSMNEEMLRFIKAAIYSDLTAVISGGTGTGKDLHKDTLIPTPEGFKRVGDITTGDTLFDENGKPTGVLRKYSPMDPKHYELVFKNGERVKAGQGHLWKVSMLNEKQKFGHLSSPILSDAEVGRLRDELSKFPIEGNKWATGGDLMKILGREKMSFPIRQTLEGLGTKGNDVLSFDIKEIQGALSAGVNTPLKQEALSSVLSYAKSTLTLGEVKNAIPKRHITRSLSLRGHDNGDNLYYVKSEAISHLIKDHEDRMETRRMLDTSYASAIRPTRLMTTEELVEYGVRNNTGRLNFAIEKISGAVQYDEQDLSIHPYTLGAWLGDGYSDGARICGVNHEVSRKMESVGETISEKKEVCEGVRKQPLYLWRVEGMQKKLRSANLLKNKHIPEQYKISSYQQRVDLISGLMDTDGWVDRDRGSANLELTNESVVKDARNIVLSLGWTATRVSSKKRSYRDESGNKVDTKDSHGFTFYPDVQIFNVKSKAEAYESRLNSNALQASRRERHYITDILPIDDNPEDYYCFEVDSPNHMFLCSESFIPTHNTTFLEASTKLFPEDIRVGVCEDTPELELRQKNVAYMHSLPWRPGMDPNNVATLSWIVQQVNRMRTDRVLVGETRGKEFADFLVAANSGMDGSLTTIHANDPISCLSKMTNFALKGNGENVPIRAINSDIAQAVDLIIQLAYDAPTGRHYVHSIVEVTNTVSDKPDAPITTGTLYRYNHADGLHEKVDAPGDILRRKLINAGIDASEFTGAAQGFGTEPKWLPGKGPADAEPKAERTLASGAKSAKKGGSRNIGRSI